MATTILTAIIAINPSASVSIADWEDNDYDKITWNDGTTPISEADIKAKQAELDGGHDALEWERNREGEYPTVQELVVALYDTEDKAAIDAKRAEVKAKYPKP